MISGNRCDQGLGGTLLPQDRGLSHGLRLHQDAPGSALRQADAAPRRSRCRQAVTICAARRVCVRQQCQLHRLGRNCCRIVHLQLFHAIIDDGLHHALQLLNSVLHEVHHLTLLLRHSHLHQLLELLQQLRPVQGGNAVLRGPLLHGLASSGGGRRGRRLGDGRDVQGGQRGERLALQHEPQVVDLLHGSGLGNLCLAGHLLDTEAKLLKALGQGANAVTVLSFQLALELG
mmetsp:Transcript_95200/g.293592  ORF Transcript_95200/g.293592 Transcript_95200/m.293592 type:complete len:231 (+) Transcript_95200:111-803(+)